MLGRPDEKTKRNGKKSARTGGIARQRGIDSGSEKGGKSVKEQEKGANKKRGGKVGTVPEIEADDVLKTQVAEG